MAKTIIFPAAIRYQSELAATCANLKAVGYKFDTDTLDKITDAGQGAAGRHRRARDGDGAERTRRRVLEHAKHYCDEVLPAMLAVRKTADELEGMVADDLWPLPTYQEMLFIK